MNQVLDLFCGVGGIRKGFDDAGFDTVFSNDYDPKTKITFDLNFNSPYSHIQDIREINLDDLPDFNWLTGGFPCQPFSIAGKRQGFQDEKDRGNLFFHIVDILERKRPMGVFLENVKNLVTHDDGKTFQIILHLLSEAGYHVKYKVLNSKNYGIPHNRERIFIVGFRNKEFCENFEFPETIPLTTTVQELLDPVVDESYHINGTDLYEKVKEEIVDPTTCYQWRRAYVRENKRNLMPCQTASMSEKNGLPIVRVGDVIRSITPREAFRFQGFPDSYRLPEIPDRILYKQSGNSVTVPVIKAIADNIMQLY